MIRSLVKRFLQLLGKSDHKIIVVYAASRDAWREAAAYVSRGAPQFPIWLVIMEPPEAVPQCERVIRAPRGPGLLWRVARVLWPRWTVLNVVTYTGERGFGWMKLAPFLAFPPKLLVMNEHRDFFSGLPFGLAVHGARRLRDFIATASETVKDFLLGIFWKVFWTAFDPLLSLTAQPWRRPQEPLTPAPPSDHAERFVTFDEGEPAGDPGLLLPLFDRPDTFAASFQPGRSGFQKDILPRAAFRRLQPGEATAVLAPLGGADPRGYAKTRATRRFSANAEPAMRLAAAVLARGASRLEILQRRIAPAARADDSRPRLPRSRVLLAAAARAPAAETGRRILRRRSRQHLF